MNAKSIRVRAESIFSTENEERIFELLQSKMDFAESDQVHYAQSSPLLFGESVSVDLPRYESDHSMIMNAKEAMHRIKWKTADVVREQTAHFFGTTLEEIGSYGFFVEQWREAPNEINAVLFHLCSPRFTEQNYDFVASSAKKFLMPIVISQEVGLGDEPEGILHTEDETSVFVVRKNNQLKYLRSVNCGISTIRDHLSKNLECSSREAEVLMQNCLEGKLSEGSQKLTMRLMRQLLPLWAGLFSVSIDNIPFSERPQKLLVTGLFPKMIAQMYCRPQFLMKWTHKPQKVAALTLDNDLLGMHTSLKIALKQLSRESYRTKVSHLVGSLQGVTI